MASKTAGQIEEIRGRIEQFAGEEVSKKVMEGSDRVAASSNPEIIALWVKDAIDRLDAATGQAERVQIMLACGHNCVAINKRPVELGIARRRKYPDEEAFLHAEVKKPPKGIRLEMEERLLFQYYTPHSYGRGMRCYCGLMRGLPEGVTASPTYCQCSRGFVEKYWEGILGRKVSVELGPTAISGSDECQFIIHL